WPITSCRSGEAVRGSTSRTVRGYAPPVMDGRPPARTAGSATGRRGTDEAIRLRAHDRERRRSGPRAVAPDAGGRVDRAGVGRLRRRLPSERPGWWRAGDRRDGRAEGAPPATSG